MVIRSAQTSPAFSDEMLPQYSNPAALAPQDGRCRSESIAIGAWPWKAMLWIVMTEGTAPSR